MTKKQHFPSKDKPWFCFDGDDYEYFATENDAIEASKVAISYFLDESWDESVLNVMVGKVTKTAEKINVVERPDESEISEEGLDNNGVYWDDSWEYICDYKATPLK